MRYFHMLNISQYIATNALDAASDNYGKSRSGAEHLLELERGHCNTKKMARIVKLRECWESGGVEVTLQERGERQHRGNSNQFVRSLPGQRRPVQVRNVSVAVGCTPDELVVGWLGTLTLRAERHFGKTSAG